MNGFPSSPLYAPTPRLIFLGLVSFLKASVTPRMASGGPIGTLAHAELKETHKNVKNICIVDHAAVKHDETRGP